MVLLDHDELDRPDGPARPGGPLGGGSLWPVRYRRADHLDGDDDRPLGTAVRDLVEARTGARPAGPVRTLTQVRTHGYVFNPLTVHWCLAPVDGDPEDVRIEVVVLEVTNTPWRERHCYVVDARPGAADRPVPGPVDVGTLDTRGRLHADIPKVLHVSPFMTTDQTYRLTCSPPTERTWLRLETFEAALDGSPLRIFDADLVVQLRPLTRRQVLAALLRRPLPTQRVWIGIHLHALVLALMRIPFVPHPDRSAATTPADRSGRRREVVRP